MNLFETLGHAVHIPWIYLSALFAAGLLFVAGLSVRRAVAGEHGGVVPDEGVTIRNVFEVVIEALGDLGETTIGENWRAYFPVVGSIFFFVLVSNVMSLVPGILGSTGDVNVTFAWAIISFLVYNYVGIKQHGWKYIYQFMGPSIMNMEIGGKHYHVRLLAPVFLVLEIPLHFARILTLGIRLLANMFADHTVVLVWLGMVPLAVPAIFMGLGLLVSFLQAFVFALLTMIYIGQALEEPH
ncbi:MAG: F0F1 ATP synthase subunit A [Spirochaetaceae bacterium]|nr:F0F1 ATP synthase subunit A [Myxococcales bacterium]MCB9723942.1 F0F1 ATP synthase subunit A [Spirochaetaceae bacterium]HPG24527.1 F0F1 ATP synthase subunit A [Myxococcota bacterium]